jgi:cellulose synthase/poly-beta-1,6-N-acetylglucosamine synthase-like glycosyltransferase
MVMLEWVFWLSVVAVLYAYAGYPLALHLLARVSSRPLIKAPADYQDGPSVSMVIPVHNERATIEAKLENVYALQYPGERFEVLFVCDGCTDGTLEYLRERARCPVKVLELSGRGGKGAALNAGLENTRYPIVVFSDASIMLQPDAIAQIVRSFAAPDVGCVSGEDRIADAGGEGLYGRYELSLRRLESDLHSIVGASGSFYAQRRQLCGTFLPGLAPDFLSVLRTVERGYRAVAEPAAWGSMAELADPRAEFNRKVRTILRGITTLGQFTHLLNPFTYGWFAFELFSHKLIRWMVPFFLALLFASSAFLAANGSGFYLIAWGLQVIFYVLALTAFASANGAARWFPARVSLYFTSANVATVAAWLRFLGGSRQELWSPSRR